MNPGLWLITDQESARHPLGEICDAALTAGFAGVMLREKSLPGGPLLELAHTLQALCHERGASFMVNDRLDVALCTETAGLHTGANGLSVTDCRRLLGSQRVLGYSAHHTREAGKALGEGADYVTLGPVCRSLSKPDCRPQGLEWLTAACRDLPQGAVFALGGVQTSTAAAIRRTGVAGAFIMGELMRSGDPLHTARGLADAWGAP